jgi:hypothetical protein
MMTQAAVETVIRSFANLMQPNQVPIAKVRTAGRNEISGVLEIQPGSHLVWVRPLERLRGYGTGNTYRPITEEPLAFIAIEHIESITLTDGVMQDGK